MTNAEPVVQAKAPLEVIAASLRRERRRTGLSLTEVARRAGIAKSTLSQLESALATRAWRRCGRSASPWTSRFHGCSTRPGRISR